MARKQKQDIGPEEPTQLLTLTEAQARLVADSMRLISLAEKVVDERKQRLGDLLSMIRPEGANGFNPDTMTFYSVPQEEPKE